MSRDKSYREDALDAAKEVFNENTRSSAVVKACEHARQDRRAKEHALTYLTKRVEPVTAHGVITRLTTRQLAISTSLRLNPNHDSPQIEVEFPNTDLR